MTSLESHLLSLLRGWDEGTNTEQLFREAGHVARAGKLPAPTIEAVAAALESLWQRDEIELGDGQTWRVVFKRPVERVERMLFA